MTELLFFLQTVGKYMIEIWKAAGMDMNNVEYLWASEEVRVRREERHNERLQGQAEGDGKHRPRTPPPPPPRLVEAMPSRAGKTPRACYPAF